MGTRRHICGAILIVFLSFSWMNFYALAATPSYGDRCSRDNATSCYPGNMTCAENSTCVCAAHFVHGDYNICYPTFGYGEPCRGEGNTNPCYDTDTTCISDVNGTARCLCDLHYYRTLDDTCSHMDDLKVKLTNQKRETNQVTFTWDADNHNMNVTYSMKSIQGQGHLEGQVTSTGATWSGLTPGRKYNFNVTTTLPPEGFYPKKTIDYSISDIWTLPEMPGNVTSVEFLSGSPGTDYLYNISFLAAPPEVASYSMTIQGDTQTGNAPFLIFRSLKPGRGYIYTVTAYNLVQDPSVAFVGNFSTQPEYPGEVRNFTIIQDDFIAENITLTFLCPDENALGRNVLGYRINKTLIDSVGKQTTKSYPLSANRSDCREQYTALDVGGLSVEKNYSFSVRAWNELYNGNFTQELNFYVAPKAPALDRLYAPYHLVSGTEWSADQSQVEVSLCPACLLDSRQGRVLDVKLVICVDNDISPCLGTEAERTWNYARRFDFTVPYRTTPLDWMGTLTASFDVQKYTIGGNRSCLDMTASETDIFCNGPLPVGQDIEIYLYIIQCNTVGCSRVNFKIRSKISDTKGPDLALALGLGLGLGVGLLVIGVILAVVICRRRGRCGGKKDPYDPYVCPVPDPVDKYSGSPTLPPELPPPTPHRKSKLSPPSAEYILPLGPEANTYNRADNWGGSHHTYNPDSEGGADIDSIYDYIEADCESLDRIATDTAAPTPALHQDNFPRFDYRNH